MAPGQLAEGMEGFHHPRALRPAAPGAGGQGNDCDFPVLQRGEAQRLPSLRRPT